MKKVTVIGHFGFGQECRDGQTVKTRSVADGLVRCLGEDEVATVDTRGGGIGNLLRAPFRVLRALKQSRNVVILPAQNGLRVYAPLLSAVRLLFRGRKIHYVVIGGWLPGFVQTRRVLKWSLGCFDAIYVETSTMETALGKQGFENITVMPNFKNLTVLHESELVYPDGEPYRLCTFSRVMREKGIGDAVDAVKNVNESLGRRVIELDIYGQVDSGQREWFEALQKTFPDFIRYCGCAEPHESTKVLRGYFALLFPTRFYTEGIPGTLIDAYAAGVPVIAARWENYGDIVDEGITGLGYEMGNVGELCYILRQIALAPSSVAEMKPNCLSRAYEYTPQTVMQVLAEKIDAE